MRYSASPVSPSRSVTAIPVHSSGSISEYASHCESLCSGISPSVASPRFSCGWRQQSPNATPSRCSRSGQIGPSASSRTSRISGAGILSCSARSLRTSNRPPGRGESASANRSGRALARPPRWRSTAARPSTPASGLSSSAWNAAASVLACRCAMASASARNRSPRLAERPPPSNRRRLARAKPSDRAASMPVIGSTNFQSGPAPASSSTEVITKSNAARASAAASPQAARARNSAHRSWPSTWKCRQRAWNGT